MLVENRRPIQTRESGAVRALGAVLARLRVSPNAISCSSIAFAGAAAACMVLAPEAIGVRAVALFAAAAGFIQLRLLANLLDGLVAIEGGRATPAGAVFNELPDRVSDVVVLVGAGYAAAATGTVWDSHLGWAAAVLAVLTAYVRALGASLGTRQHFEGPMAKPHRMAVMTLGCVVAAVESALGWPPRALSAALSLVVLGTLVTVVKRTVLVTREVEQ